MSIHRFLMTFVLVCLLAVSAAMAQDFRATIIGTVTDPSGAAVPGAGVKVTRLDTNETKEAKTTGDGTFTIPYLEPGIYTMEVGAPGFQTLRRERIVLQVADKLNLPVRLKVGAVTETVTVTAEQEVIETASADRGLVFDPVKVQQYPLNGRQTYMLLSLTPGVIFTTENFGPTGNSGTRGWDVTSAYKINGARSGQNLFLLNGAPISDNGGTWQVAPNVEAVQEFKVMTNTYDASYGRFGGGVVNTTVKSGGNSWHGNVFDFFRNSVTDANYFQNNLVGQKKGFHNQHQFGGVVGGPIRKDKDFLFASFEGWREVLPASVTSDVPPQALRTGDFSALGIKIYDPLTSHACGGPGEPCSTSSYWRKQFPNNVIPAARISPVGQKILSYYPQANGPNPNALNQNFIAGGNLGRYHYDQPMGRWDHNISSKDKIYVMVTFQHGREYRDSTGFGPPAGSGDINSQRTDQNYIAAWTHVLSPTAVLDVRGSFGRFTSVFPRYTDFDLTTDKIGMTGMIHAPTFNKNTVPVIRLGGYTFLFGFNGANTLQSWNTYNQWNFAPSLTMTHGRHTIKTGFEYNYVARGDASYGWSNGNFLFDSFWTRQLDARQQNSLDGSAVASLLLGTPTSGTIDYNDTFYRTRPYFGFYVQDDWKVSPRVTINLGLRYDVQVPWLERFNRVNRGADTSTKNPLSDQILAKWAQLKADYDKTNPKHPYPAPPAALTGGLLFAGKNQPRRLYETDWTNFGPRIGVAWQFREKTVLRAGAGVYYQSPTQNGTTTGYNQSTGYLNSLDGFTPSAGLTGPYSLVQPFPNGFTAPAGSSQGLLTNIGNGISFDAPRFKIPRTYQYSLGFQRELPHGILVDVSFAGNYQIFATLGYNRNNISLADTIKGLGGTGDPTYLSTQVPNPFFGILPVTSGFGSNSTITRSNLLRPDPIFSNITNNLIQAGKYRSDALQVRIEKRVLGGASTGVMTWVLSYTFSKAYEANHRLQDWNLAEPIIRELDNTDIPQSVSFSGVWDLPLGRGRKFLNFNNPIGKTIANEWRFNWTVAYVSGYPVGWFNRINNCGDWHASGIAAPVRAEQTEYSWFNNDNGQTLPDGTKRRSCYAQLPTNALRTLPDRFPDIREPQKPQFNIGLQKTLPISERFKLQLRGEAFNLTNSAIRPGPSTDPNDSRFGMLPLQQRNFPRVVQFSGKFYF